MCSYWHIPIFWFPIHIFWDYGQLLLTRSYGILEEYQNFLWKCSFIVRKQINLESCKCTHFDPIDTTIGQSSTFGLTIWLLCVLSSENLPETDCTDCWLHFIWGSSFFIFFFEILERHFSSNDIIIDNPDAPKVNPRSPPTSPIKVSKS